MPSGLKCGLKDVYRSRLRPIEQPKPRINGTSLYVYHKRKLFYLGQDTFVIVLPSATTPYPDAVLRYPIQKGGVHVSEPRLPSVYVTELIIPLAL